MIARSAWFTLRVAGLSAILWEAARWVLVIAGAR